VIDVGPLAPHSEVEIRGDPRISNLPPAWLPPQGWREQLDALGDDDVAWIERHWQAAGGPHHDTSWMTMETIGSSLWPAVAVMAVSVLLAVGYVLAVTW
jgi:hypothetical protein